MSHNYQRINDLLKATYFFTYKRGWLTVDWDDKLVNINFILFFTKY